MSCSVPDPGHPLSGEEWYDTSTVTGKKTIEKQTGGIPRDFPHSIVLKASAGSGKTHELTLRFVVFLLSDAIPKNGLRNILAITFSNNAAAEMRERILEWLKALSLGREREINELASLTGLGREELISRAQAMIATILEHYADLQVKTIDSFMTGIFKTSAIDLGFSPDFEVVLSNDALMEYAFDIFLKNVREKSRAGRFLEEVIGRIIEAKLQTAGFPWDPSGPILEEVKNIYRKVATTWKPVRARDHAAEISALKKRIRTAVEELEALIVRSGLERNSRSAFLTILDLVRDDRFPDILGKGLKTLPVKAYKGKDAEKAGAFDAVQQHWNGLLHDIAGYMNFAAEAYYFPYLEVYTAVRETIDRVKKKEERVFIEDINRTLAELISRDVVPDIYFRLGETIHHYLIDEFQDTSPVQWKNLFPLIENVLSQQGSLFVVGDTKQAIYGFRDADYRIMKEMEEPGKQPFPSASHEVRELTTNYRSMEQIIDYTAKVFKQKVASDEKYGGIATLSGLTDYVQQVKTGNESRGHVRVEILGRDGDETPERPELQGLIARLRQRGYGFRDIAILTFENDDVVNITSWLNEQSVPFISYSSLDVRRRKVIAEIVALLRFLDSPLDDLSFATVILGEMLAGLLTEDGIGPDRMREFVFRNRRGRPLYKVFQAEFPGLWERCLGGLFRSAGYLPLYDLVTEIYRLFGLFKVFREEEAALAKMLEVVKVYEESSRNSLRDFIEFVADEERPEADWNIDVPRDMEAVKVMTVHKAKGLGFPVVVLLAYGKVAKGFSYVLKEAGKTGELCFTRLNRKIADIVPELDALYSELSTKETVNSLNSLYVALTRAKSEMYVLCVKSSGRKESFHVCEFLPQEEYPERPMPAEILPGEQRRSLRIGLEHGSIRSIVSVTAEQSMNREERQWGEFVHAVLARIEFWEAGCEAFLREAIRQENQESTTFYPEDAVCSLLAGFLNSAPAADLFSREKGRTVQREMEIADRRGNLFRLDRLLIDSERVVVVDFKTGKERERQGEYIRQIRQYMQILGSIYPGRTVSGRIAYIELMQIEMVA
jgi:ATP-dependent exoDNAse (exonuclease V) beta subunit